MGSELGRIPDVLQEASNDLVHLPPSPLRLYVRTYIYC